jgi:hypothetical protein
MAYRALAPIYHFHEGSERLSEVGEHCAWCDMPIKEDEHGYEIAVRGVEKKLVLQSAYHSECWSARWIDQMQATAERKEDVRMLYQMHYYTYLMGGVAPSVGMVEELLHGGQPEEGISRRGALPSKGN